MNIYILLLKDGTKGGKWSKGLGRHSIIILMKAWYMFEDPSHLDILEGQHNHKRWEGPKPFRSRSKLRGCSSTQILAGNDSGIDRLKNID